MKRSIYSLSALLFSLLFLSSQTNAGTNSATVTNSVCFNDGFYNWNITYTGSGGSYSATGTVNVDGTNWSVYGWGNFSSHMGAVEFHASNPNADGCQSGYVDSFTYTGNAQIVGNGPNTTFSGSGDWVNYCSGSVYTYGSWTAYGPCSNNLRIVPYGPAKSKGNTSSLTGKNASNSVCFNDGFYNWHITYTDQGAGNYSVTGSLSVDGNIWTVWGLGNFVGHTGTVELHAHNPNPDGCVSYSDSFTYWGNAQITGNGPNTTFTGSGNWTSYCFGGVLFTGTWSAFGPCNSNLKSQPNGPAKHADIFSMKISPNPVKNSSTLTYSLAKASQVKITVFNYMQQPVQFVVDKKETAGSHSYSVNASSLISGSYRVVAIVDGKYYTYALQVAK